MTGREEHLLAVIAYLVRLLGGSVRIEPDAIDERDVERLEWRARTQDDGHSILLSVRRDTVVSSTSPGSEPRSASGIPGSQPIVEPGPGST